MVVCIEHIYNTCSQILTALRYKLDFGPSKMKIIAHLTSNSINHAPLKKKCVRKNEYHGLNIVLTKYMQYLFS